VPVVRACAGTVADMATCGTLPVMPRHQDSLIGMPVSLLPEKPAGSLYDAKVNPPPHRPPSAFGRAKESVWPTFESASPVVVIAAATDIIFTSAASGVPYSSPCYGEQSPVLG